MIVFPNSKINLGLRILQKRNDGYHNLETVFYPVPLYDVLEITPYPLHQKNFTIPFSKSGLMLEGDPSDNLCIKAFRLLKKDHPHLPNVQMHLHKAIPSGGGLGGGSSDGAFTISLLNKEFDLRLSEEQLLQYALKLGSDCPFFIINKPCLAKGRGEVLVPIELDLSAYSILLVNPGLHINTGRAFLSIKPVQTEHSIMEIIKKPIVRWKDELVNDFETSVFREHKEIVEIKDRLYIAGAIYASMSGSGSTVYGIFPKSKVPEISFSKDYFVKELPGQLNQRL